MIHTLRCSISRSHDPTTPGSSSSTLVARTSNNAHFGFTYIEILITLSLLGILFVPMMQFFSQAVESTRTSRDLITAVSLARWEMERLKNLSVNMDALRSVSDTTYPPADAPALAMNERNWRIHRRIESETMPWKVWVAVKVDEEPKPVAELVTLISETSWVQQ